MGSWKRLRWGLFLSWIFSCGPARAQDLWELSEARADPWEQRWDRSLWDSSGTFTLALTGGAQGVTVLTTTEGVPGEKRSTRREIYGLATLQFPLEQWMTRSRQATIEPAPDSQGLPFASGKDESSAASPEHEQGGSEDESREAIAKEIRRNRAKKEEKAANAERSAKELLFLVRELVLRVRRASGAGRHEARFSSLVKRARWSGLAPELRLRGVYGFDRTTSLEDAVGIYPGETTTRGARDSLAEARLTFHLDRLVFGSQETTLEKQRLLLKQAEDKRVKEAIELLLKWRTADALTRNETLLPEEQADAIVQTESSLSQLHVLTNGWFEGAITVRAVKRRVGQGTAD